MIPDFVKRLVFYGAITAVFAVPIAYDLGKKAGTLDATVATINSAKLERVSENQYLAINPDNKRKYVIDFSSKTVVPYSYDTKTEQKKLEQLFSN
jgi:6-phosphogluconolactonase (cycloisomerase 2 family)